MVESSHLNPQVISVYTSAILTYKHPNLQTDKSAIVEYYIMLIIMLLDINI